MPRLPIEDWPPPTAEARLQFLRAVAYFEPRSADVEPDDLPESMFDRQSDRPTDHHALLAAADLAFAIDQTSDAVFCIREAVTDLVRRAADLRELAMAGAITGDLVVTPQERGFKVDSRSEWKFAPFYPSDPLSPEGLEMTLDLLLASLASGEPIEAFLRSHPAKEGPWLPPREPLVQALDIFGRTSDAAESPSVDMAHAALTVSVASWSRDLVLHRRDRHHWDQARVRGPLVDLRLLAFEVGTLRQPRNTWRNASPGNRRQGGLVADLQRFLRDLAEELLGTP